MLHMLYEHIHVLLSYRDNVITNIMIRGLFEYLSCVWVWVQCVRRLPPSGGRRCLWCESIRHHYFSTEKTNLTASQDLFASGSFRGISAVLVRRNCHMIWRRTILCFCFAWTNTHISFEIYMCSIHSIWMWSWHFKAFPNETTKWSIGQCFQERHI